MNMYMKDEYFLALQYTCQYKTGTKIRCAHTRYTVEAYVPTTVYPHAFVLK